MPKYWGKQIFAHGIFTEVGQKQKTEKQKKRPKNQFFFVKKYKSSSYAKILGETNFRTQEIPRSG